MWNRIVELESVIEDRPKSAQAGREIAKFFFLKAIASLQEAGRSSWYAGRSLLKSPGTHI